MNIVPVFGRKGAGRIFLSSCSCSKLILAASEACVLWHLSRRGHWIDFCLGPWHIAHGTWHAARLRSRIRMPARTLARKLVRQWIRIRILWMSVYVHVYVFFAECNSEMFCIFLSNCKMVLNVYGWWTLRTFAIEQIEPLPSVPFRFRLQTPVTPHPHHQSMSVFSAAPLYQKIWKKIDLPWQSTCKLDMGVKTKLETILALHLHTYIWPLIHTVSSIHT